MSCSIVARCFRPCLPALSRPRGSKASGPSKLRRAEAERGERLKSDGQSSFLINHQSLLCDAPELGIDHVVLIVNLILFVNVSVERIDIVVDNNTSHFTERTRRSRASRAPGRLLLQKTDQYIQYLSLAQRVYEFLHSPIRITNCQGWKVLSLLQWQRRPRSIIERSSSEP